MYVWYSVCDSERCGIVCVWGGGGGARTRARARVCVRVITPQPQMFRDNDTDLFLTTLQFMTYKSILGWRLLLTFCHDKEKEEEVAV